MSNRLLPGFLWDQNSRAAFGYAIVALGFLGLPIGIYRTCKRVFFVMTVVTNMLATGAHSVLSQN